MSQRHNLYVGRAGQMAAMAEFLWRGWNVALPEVDVGEDIFVIKDEGGQLWRVQVKTATARLQRDGYTAQFSVSLRQLETGRAPDLVYVFAVRGAAFWEPFIIIDRDVLWNEYQIHGIGKPQPGQPDPPLQYPGFISAMLRPRLSPLSERLVEMAGHPALNISYHRGA